MKRALSIILLTTICFISSGCVFSIGGGRSQRNCCTHQEYVNSDPELTEIRAASKLVSDSAKSRIYKAIAARPGLSAKGRAFLADEVTKHLVLDSAKEEVLLILANNNGDKQGM